MSGVLEGVTPGDRPSPGSGGEERPRRAGPEGDEQEQELGQERDAEQATGQDAAQAPNQEEVETERDEEKSQAQKTDGEASSVITQSSQNAVSEIRIPRGRGRPPRNANRADIGPSGLVSITSIWADDDKPKGKRGRPRIRPLEPEEKAEPEAAPTKPLKVKRPKGPKDILHDIIHRLYKRDKQQIFAEPVNAEFVPDYYQVIKNPMDFSTMRKKVSQDEYKDFDSFASDIKLIITNCYTYNKIGTMVYRMGLILEETWDKSLEGSKTRYEQAIKNLEEYEERKRAGEIISDSESEPQQPAWNLPPTSPTMESPNPSNQRSMITRRMEARLSNPHSPWMTRGPAGAGTGGPGTGERDLGQDMAGRRAQGGHPFGGTMMNRVEVGRAPYPGAHGAGHQSVKSKGPTLADICRGGAASVKESLERLKVDRFEPFSSLIRQMATQPCIRTPTVEDWYVFDKQLSEIQYRNSVKRFIGEDSIQALKKIMDIETALLEIDPHPRISKVPLSDTRLFGLDTEDFAAFNQNLQPDGNFLLGVGESHVKVALTLQDEVQSLNLSAIRELVSKYTQPKTAHGSFPNSAGAPGHASFNKPLPPHPQTGDPKLPEGPPVQRPSTAGLEPKTQDQKPAVYNRINHQGEILGGPTESPNAGSLPVTPSGPPHSLTQARIAYKHGYPVGPGPVAAAGPGAGPGPGPVPVGGGPGKPGSSGITDIGNSGGYYENCPPAKVQKFDPPQYPSHAFPQSHSGLALLSSHPAHPVSHGPAPGGPRPGGFPQAGGQTPTSVSGGGGGSGAHPNFGQMHGGVVQGHAHGNRIPGAAAPAGPGSSASSDTGAAGTSPTAANGPHLGSSFNSNHGAASSTASVSAAPGPPEPGAGAVVGSSGGGVTGSHAASVAPFAATTPSSTPPPSAIPTVQYLSSNELRRHHDQLAYPPSVMGNPINRQGHHSLNRTQSGNPSNHYLQMSTGPGVPTGPGVVTGIPQQRVDHNIGGSGTGPQKTAVNGYMPNDFMARGVGPATPGGGNVDGMYGLFPRGAKKPDLPLEMSREDHSRMDPNMYMMEGGPGMNSIGVRPHQQMLHAQPQGPVQTAPYHPFPHSQVPMHKQPHVNAGGVHGGNGGNSFYPKFNGSHVNGSSSIHVHSLSAPAGNANGGSSQFPQDGGSTSLCKKNPTDLN
ncbi:bromo domain-containing protein [Cryptosporidium canis]|uniref:Bromo domain-containing protein n=1 Tax=Cryptosporidium canis TaxID=195482 RepID=A0A9D5DF76_9CRYT|nr:bromo domain-containing protein [Cryptosporidium canis]